jgi:hypothetical protein
MVIFNTAGVERPGPALTMDVTMDIGIADLRSE